MELEYSWKEMDELEEGDRVRLETSEREYTGTVDRKSLNVGLETYNLELEEYERAFTYRPDPWQPTHVRNWEKLDDETTPTTLEQKTYKAVEEAELLLQEVEGRKEESREELLAEP